MKKVLIAYLSSTGKTEKMAEYIAEGIRFSGQEAVVKKIEDIKAAAEIAGYDGYILGSPTYSLSIPKSMREFLLLAHFDREETAVLAAFKEQGDSELASAFYSLLLEHKDLRNRLDHTKNHVSQLTGGELSRHTWEATAHDMRAHITHTRKLLETHAEVEQELLRSLHRRLLGKEEG